MLNKVMLIGRLGQDPDLKYTPSGDAVTTFNLATDESYNDRDGNKIDKAEWHRIVVFRRAAENCKTYLAKGSLVYVEGKLTTRKWQDQQGQNRYLTEVQASRIQFLDRKSDKSGQGGWDQAAGSTDNNFVGDEFGQNQPYRPQKNFQQKNSQQRDTPQGRPVSQNYNSQPQSFGSEAGMENPYGNSDMRQAMDSNGFDEVPF